MVAAPRSNETQSRPTESTTGATATATFSSYPSSVCSSSVLQLRGQIVAVLRALDTALSPSPAL